MGMDSPRAATRGRALPRWKVEDRGRKLDPKSSVLCAEMKTSVRLCSLRGEKSSVRRAAPHVVYN